MTSILQIMPWKLRRTYEIIINSGSFYYKILSKLLQRDHSNSKKIIVFICGFHGKTGGSIAISTTANLLAKRYNVIFVSYPSSFYNRLLSKDVLITRHYPSKAFLYICDVSCEISILKKLILEKNKVLITCHGFLDKLHGLKPEDVLHKLHLASLVHFVNSVQQDSFKLPEGKFIILPNSNTKILKTTFGNNIGIIGDLRDERKGVRSAIDIAIKSKAGKIHVWGSEKSADYGISNLVFHLWEIDKNKIFNSIDVLISMSQLETFGSIVIEALSAGIPCLLSDIPAFKQFQDCPGVIIADSCDENLIAGKIDYLLDHKEILKVPIMNYWKKKFSVGVISEQWYGIIENSVTWG